jgi:citrate lyase subunit beta / citryl-CoA lyase
LVRPLPPPYRRSELSTPGHDRRMLEKAAASAADLVLMDLEDGCAPNQKGPARAVIAEAARSLDWKGKVVAFRPNALSTPYFLDDLLEVVGTCAPYLDVVVLPKVQGPEDIRYVDRLLAQIEQRAGAEVGRIRLEVLIETARGVLHAEEIASASPRMAALLFGIYDYAGEIGATLEQDTFTGLEFARQKLLAAARSAGLLAVDGITARFKDLDLTRQEALRSQRMGFDGRWAIHPSQIDVLNQTFTPSVDEIRAAERRLADYRRAHAEGKGAVAVEGEMVDEATLRSDQRKVALGRRLGVLTSGGEAPK